MKTIIKTTRLAAMLLALLALALPSAIAQENSNTSGNTPKPPIPMIVKGHKWKALKQHFTNIEEGGKKRKYYVSYDITQEITEEVDIDEKTYYRFSGSKGYFREADNKVYVLDKNRKKEWVAFDYNLKIGDPFCPIVYGDNPRETFRLEQIKTLSIAGKERRVFYFSFQHYNDKRKQSSSGYEPGWGGWHPAYIDLAYPTILGAGSEDFLFTWIEGIGVLKESFVFYRPIGLTGSMPDQLLCFTDSDGVEHDIAGIGCDIDERTLVSAERPEGNLAASITLFDGQLTVEATDELPHTVAVFALDGTPLLQERSFTGTFETQLPRHDSTQPLLLLFDGKASIRLY